MTTALLQHPASEICLSVVPPDLPFQGEADARGVALSGSMAALQRQFLLGLIRKAPRLIIPAAYAGPTTAEQWKALQPDNYIIPWAESLYGAMETRLPTVSSEERLFISVSPTELGLGECAYEDICLAAEPCLALCNPGAVVPLRSIFAEQFIGASGRLIVATRPLKSPEWSAGLLTLERRHDARVIGAVQAGALVRFPATTRFLFEVVRE